jgi:hypothetical protein
MNFIGRILTNQGGECQTNWNRCKRDLLQLNFKSKHNTSVQYAIKHLLSDSNGIIHLSKLAVTNYR